MACLPELLPAYAELHCLSNFSFLRGASHAEELIGRAAELGYAALAITDECSLAGIVRAHVAAKERGFKLIVGSEFRFQDGLKLVLLAPDRRAYGALAALITTGRRRAKKGTYALCRQDLEAHLKHGLLVLCIAGEKPSLEDALWIRERFPGNSWLAVELHHGSNDFQKLKKSEAISKHAGLPLLAAGDVHMHLRSRRRLQDTLTAIRMGVPVGKCGEGLFPNGERHLRLRARLAQLYPAELIRETLKIAERCSFSLDELRYEYPAELVPEGETPASWLRHLALEGMAWRFPAGAPALVRALLERELTLIAELGYEAFFLTVHDVVKFARTRGILCQGRGSAANSAVCYCLRITEVDPENGHALFERFMSKERNEPPDIDVDFEHERREEVIQYVYAKYGRERAALAATVICYRRKSALRDLGRALEVDPESPQLLALAGELIGFPRHLSQHVGGFVISRGPLAELVPVENAAMIERTVIQWDKDDLEALGLLKVDVLALVVIEVAIVRPGPIQGGMVHPYLRRRQGLEPVNYPSKAVQAVLERTLGIPIFQEQVMQLAMVAAGFSPGEADQLRRAMAAWKKKGGLEPFEEKLKRGMQGNGYTPGFADSIYRQILGFGDYGFPESHSASFALLVYCSAWLKCHHPAAFLTALLNSQPMGFYSPSQLIQDARRHGVEVRPADAGLSQWDCNMEDGAVRQGSAVRLGLRMVGGLAAAAGERIAASRPHVSVEDLAQRARLNRRDLKCLAAAGALQSLAGHRRNAHWAASGVEKASAFLPSEAGTAGRIEFEPPGEGEEIVADYQSLGFTLGRHPLALLRGVLSSKRFFTSVKLNQLPHGSKVRAAGLVTCRQRPDTASGVVFVTLEDESGCVNVVVWRDLLERQRRELLGARLLGVEGVIQREGLVVHLLARRLEDHSRLLGHLRGEAQGALRVRSRDFH